MPPAGRATPERGLQPSRSRVSLASRSWSRTVAAAAGSPPPRPTSRRNRTATPSWSARSGRSPSSRRSSRCPMTWRRTWCRSRRCGGRPRCWRSVPASASSRWPSSSPMPRPIRASSPSDRPASARSPILRSKCSSARPRSTLIHVPFRSTSESLPQLIGGQIDALFGDGPIIAPQVHGGGIVALAVAGPARGAGPAGGADHG